LTGTLGYKNAKEAKRRAEILQRTPEWVDLDAIRKFYMGCPKGHHVDHELPLKGRLVSGLHVLGNLQYLPADENVRKHNKFTPYVTTNNQQ
jgi:hypothetical protein